MVVTVSLPFHITLHYIVSYVLKGWRMEEAASSDKSISLISNAERLVQPQQQQYIVNIARARLQSLERNIERRYLKPPLGRRYAVIHA